MTGRSSYSTSLATTAHRLFRCRSITMRLLAPLAAMLLLSGVAAAEGPALSLRVADVLALQERCGSEAAQNESFELAEKCVAAGAGTQLTKIQAFEEHRHFVYALGFGTIPVEASESGKSAPVFFRSVILLKPRTVVVVDGIFAGESKGPFQWLLRSDARPEVADGRIRIARENGEILCETLSPEKTTTEKISVTDGEKPDGGYCARVTAAGDKGHAVFVHVLHLRTADEKDSAARSELVKIDDQHQLTVSTPQRVFRLTSADGGSIEITTADGEILLPKRLLPAGVLPHGPEGVRLMERWDSAYHGDRRPGWDIGRPSSELQKAVESGAVKPGKAVVLGCGTGTNAIYLAGKGFDVTGIDIAPTALARAKAKADKAGVKVRWMVADVLNLPENLGPVDFIFDRGCYHGVRRSNAAGYVETVRRLSQPGTQLLILAGNANEERQYGPPRVREEELRGDFSASFDFQWLRETRFDSTDPNATGAMAWSAMLRRKAE